MIPRVINAQGDTREAKSGGTLNVSAVTVNYLLTGPDGTFVESVMTGESADSGDKSMSKAISLGLVASLKLIFAISFSTISKKPSVGVT